MTLGVPTVVDAATVANDTLNLVIDSLKNEAGNGTAFYKMLEELDHDQKYTLIHDTLSSAIGDMMVTPKNIDTLVEDISKIIANGINIALHDGIGLEDVDQYLS